MYGKFQEHLQKELAGIEEAGLFKRERIIATPQDASIKLVNGQEVIIFCANNYLGLSSHPKVIDGAKKALDERGFGMSSVRFICGTQDIHKELEHKIAKFLGTVHHAFTFTEQEGIDAILMLFTIWKHMM